MDRNGEPSGQNEDSPDQSDSGEGAAVPPPPPPPAPPDPSSESPSAGSRRRWKTWQAVALAGVTFLIGVVVGSAGSEDTTTEVSSGSEDTERSDGAEGADARETTSTSATTTTTEASAEVGSRENPVPPGEEINLTTEGPQAFDWNVKLVSYEPNGTQAVMQENQFNDPPSEGKTFALFTVEMTYNGPNESAQAFDFSYGALDPSNVAYTESDDACGVIPNQLQQAKDVFQGGTITGNLCFAVTEEDASNLLFFLEGLFSEGKVFFATTGDANE